MYVHVYHYGSHQELSGTNWNGGLRGFFARHGFRVAVNRLMALPLAKAGAVREGCKQPV
jgi:hypothetical protein